MEQKSGLIKLGLPKGKMEKGVFELLAAAGISVIAGERAYRPAIRPDHFDAKMLKPHDIVEMLHLGSRDIGFTGADWVAELEAEVVDLLDTGLDPVRLIAAAPSGLLVDGSLPKKHLVVASEYTRLTNQWIAQRGLQATFVRSYGATEVFPPEDADCIVDNMRTGATLRANNLEVVDELMTSSTRLYANPRSLDNPTKRPLIETLVLLLTSVLEARKRVMLELNVSAECLEAVIAQLPCMRQPTISTLHGNGAYAVKAAVPRADLAKIIPMLKQAGGSDIVVTSISQIVG